jgi:hypothetical protein
MLNRWTLQSVLPIELALGWHWNWWQRAINSNKVTIRLKSCLRYEVPLVLPLWAERCKSSLLLINGAARLEMLAQPD